MNRSGEPPRVVVVGAGMAGLGAALELRAGGADVVVLDRADHVGGRVHAIEVDGVPVDVGAQFVVRFERRIVRAVTDAGLDLRAHPGRAAVVHGGRPWRIDRLDALVRSGLLPGRARARLPLLAARVLVSLPRLRPHDLAAAGPLDVRPAAHLARRWAGPEVTDRLLAPLVRGLLYGDLETTSQALLLLLLRVSLSSRRRYGVDGPLTRLPEALAHGLDVRLGTEVTAVRRAGGRWMVESTAGALPADGVVCATTADAAASLTRGVPDAPGGFLRTVTYARTAVVVAETDAPGPPGTLLFTERENPLLAAVNAPPRGTASGPTLVRVFLSDRGAALAWPLDDDALADTALAAVRAAGGRWAAQARPRAVWRWAAAVPRFDVGAVRAPAVRQPSLLDVGALAFCGDYLGGPHLEGAFRSGQAAARRVLARVAGAART